MKLKHRMMCRFFGACLLVLSPVTTPRAAPDPHDPIRTVRTEAPPEGHKLQLLPFNAGNMSVAEAPYGVYYRISAFGFDPYVCTSPLVTGRGAEEFMLSFEYRSAYDLPFIEVFFAEPLSESRSIRAEPVPIAPEWTLYSIDMRDALADIGWGEPGDYLRLDFGDNPGYSADLRNLTLRASTSGEDARYENQRNMKIIP